MTDKVTFYDVLLFVVTRMMALTAVLILWEDLENIGHAHLGLVLSIAWLVFFAGGAIKLWRRHRAFALDERLF